MADVIHIDRQAYPADPGRNLLEVCLSLGMNLPYFCWHPALGSVGACRQCAVKQFKDENDSRGRIVMACMTPATPGTRISIADPEASAFRRSVIEWLMTGHPHDCPVCDEGGECHLQDMTLMTGHAYRRCRAPKRTFRNQYLGPFVNHEMNRCIACYRCVRFYRDYAGGDDLEALASRNHVYFGRAADGPLESEFAGNLVEVCPTGVFTDATLKQHYVRKWDLQHGPSICPHCALGCNTLLGERYGMVRRVLNRYHPDINGYFLCDRGRFGYGFMNGEARLATPLLRTGPGQESRPVVAGALDGVLADLAQSLRPPAAAIGVGSPRASLEANFALRQLVGPDNFFAGMADSEYRSVSLVLDLMRSLPIPLASLREAEDSDAALVLGPDVLATAPRLGLALRRSTRHAALARADAQKLAHWDAAALQVAGRGERSPLVLATCLPTRLDDAASATLHRPPEEIARFGFAVANAIDPGAPAVEDLDEATKALAQSSAAALRAAQRPLVVAGGGEAAIRAAANIALALRRRGGKPRLAWVLPECDSLGLALLGARPLSEGLAAAGAAARPTVIVLENDLYRRAPGRDIDAFFAKSRVVAIDHIRHATTAAADLVLPAGGFDQGSGTLVNAEGRAQRYFSVQPPAEGVQDSWRWLNRLAALADAGNPVWESLDQVVSACALSQPELAGMAAAAPAADFRAVGRKIPRRPARYSGRTAMHADRSMDEPPTRPDPDSPLRYSMEGYKDYGARTPAAVLTYYRAPGWNSAQAINKFQAEVGGDLLGGDPGIRLLAQPTSLPGYFGEIPPPFAARPGQWLLLPRHLIFGGEELSRLSPPVAQMAPAPVLLLAPADLEALGLAGGEAAQVDAGDDIVRLPVRPEPALAPGTAALPAGIPPGLDLPAWARIQRVPE